MGCGAENMRREGFELSVSPPRVVFKEEGGRRLEPLEEVICEVDDEQMGSVIEVPPILPCLALNLCLWTTALMLQARKAGSCFHNAPGKHVLIFRMNPHCGSL